MWWQWSRWKKTIMVVDQTNGTVVTDYSNRNVVVEKKNNSIMVVVMALDDSNRNAVAAEDMAGNNLFKGGGPFQMSVETQMNQAYKSDWVVFMNEGYSSELEQYKDKLSVELEKKCLR